MNHARLFVGIRTSSQIFESNKVIESDEDDDEEFDYYDYYDNYSDITPADDETFRSRDPPPPPQPPPQSQPQQAAVQFSSSTFPPPEERFADIDQEDLRHNFRSRGRQVSFFIGSFSHRHRISNIFCGLTLVCCDGGCGPSSLQIVTALLR